MSENNVEVSVIIVTWNVENIIEECLNSFFKYMDLKCEVIIVDNLSTDRTCMIVEEKFGKDVKLIKLNENIGFSKANNVGLKEATGEYIFFLNPDVIFIESIMKDMKKVLEENSDIGIVSPRLLNSDQSLQISYSNFPSIKKILFDDFKLGKLLNRKLKIKYYQTKVKSDENRYVDWTHGAAHLCKHSDVKSIGGYPDSYFMYGEDTEICMIFLKNLSKKVYYIADCELIHIGGYSEKQVINSRKIVYGTNASLYFMRKYYGNIIMNFARILLFINQYIKFILMFVICIFNNSQENKNKKAKFKIASKTILKYSGQVN